MNYSERDFDALIEIEEDAAPVFYAKSGVTGELHPVRIPQQWRSHETTSRHIGQWDWLNPWISSAKP